MPYDLSSSNLFEGEKMKKVMDGTVLAFALLLAIVWSFPATGDSSVKSSKSNTSEKIVPTKTPLPAAKTINLNSSKSNANKQVVPTKTPPPATKATTVKSSKSNSSDKVAPTPTKAPPKEPAGRNKPKGTT